MTLLNSLYGKELIQGENEAGAKSGAFSQKLLENLSDPRLRALLAHWPDLPEALRESLFHQVCETVVLQKFTQ